MNDLFSPIDSCCLLVFKCTQTCLEAVDDSAVVWKCVELPAEVKKKFNNLVIQIQLATACHMMIKRDTASHVLLSGVCACLWRRSHRQTGHLVCNRTERQHGKHAPTSQGKRPQGSREMLDYITLAPSSPQTACYQHRCGYGSQFKRHDRLWTCLSSAYSNDLWRQVCEAARWTSGASLT